MPLPTNILLVDDNRYFLDVACDFLGMQESFHVIGTAMDTQSALDQARNTQPDMILLDLNLGSQSGMKLIPQLKQIVPGGKIIVLSIMEESSYHTSVLEAGADAYVQKTQMLDTLVNTIYKLLGERPVPLQAALTPHENQNWFIHLIEESDDLIYRYEVLPQQGFTFVNSASTAITGYTPADHYADPDLGFKMVYPEDRHVLEDIAKGKLDPRQPATLRWVRKDGQVIWVEQRNVSIFNEAGELAAIEGIARDITAYKKNEENEQRWQRIFENAHWGVVTTEDGKTFSQMNPAFAAMHGYTVNELVGTRILDLFVPEALPDFYQQLHITHQTGHHIFESRHIRKDGTSFPVELDVTEILDERGDLQQRVVNVQDITERKNHQSALRESQQRYYTLVETSPDAISLFDLQLNLLMINPAGVSLFGYTTADEMIGRNAKEFFDPEELSAAVTAIEKVFENRLVRNAHFTLFHRDGTPFISEFSLSLLYDSDHQPQAVMAVTRDITARKQMESALETARAELEMRVRERTAELQAANSELNNALRLKDELLNIMSHEFRTPLTGILGMSDSLESSVYGELTERQHNAVGIITSSGRRLLRLVDQFLDYLGLQANTWRVLPRYQSLNTICRTALKAVRGSAILRKQTVSFTIEPTDIIFRTDGELFTKILGELLSNACRFTPEGGSFGLTVTGDKEKGQLELIVWDTGIGIKEDDLPKLFKPFSQLDSSLTRKYDGAGLGLAITNKLVMLLGGQIHVSSRVNEGSRFTVILPWRECSGCS